MILARNFYASKFPQLSRQKTPSRRRTLSCGDALRGLMPREKMMKKKNNLQVYELYAIIVFKWESFSQPISLSPHLFTIKGLLHGNDDFAGNTCAWKLMLYHPIGELFPALHLSSFLPCQSIFPVISPTLCQSGTPPSVCSSLPTSFSEMMILVSFFWSFQAFYFPLSNSVCASNGQITINVRPLVWPLGEIDGKRHTDPRQSFSSHP